MDYKPRNKGEIIADFEKHLIRTSSVKADSKIDYHNWVVGITSDFEKTKVELGSPQNLIDSQKG